MPDSAREMFMNAKTVKGDRMYAFIKGRFLSQSVRLSKPTAEMLDTDQFPELSYVINVASTLTGGEEQESQKTVKDHKL